MNNGSLFFLFASLFVCAFAGTLYMIFMIVNKTSNKTQSLDTEEDLQRIDTRDPTAPRISDKFIIHSTIP